MSEPEVRAVELEDPETGERGTLIGPADKIDELVRPEAVIAAMDSEETEERTLFDERVRFFHPDDEDQP